MTSRYGRKAIILATAATLVIGLVACGGNDTDTTESPMPSAEQFTALLGSDVSDYEPAGGPDELAEDSGLIVRGVIENITPGRTFGQPGSPEFTQQAVMQVVVDEVFSGTLPNGSNGKVYVELFGVEDPDELAEVAPEDSDSLLYLLKLTEASQIPGASVGNANAGRPVGQPLYATVSPQGFYLEGDSGIYEPQDAAVFPNATLEDLEPDETSFPRNEKPLDPG